MDDELFFRWLLMFVHRWLSEHGFQTRKARARASMVCDARTTEANRGRSILTTKFGTSTRLQTHFFIVPYLSGDMGMNRFCVSVWGHLSC